MRIIIVFIFGFLLHFFLAEVLSAIWKKIVPFAKKYPLHHSLLGLILLTFSAAISILGTGKNYLGESNTTLLSIFLAGAGLGMLFHHLMSENFFFFKTLEQKFIHHHEKAVDRILEILPGSLTWLALTCPFWLSFTLPFAVAYIIIIANVYWFISAVRMSLLIQLGYKRLNIAKKEAWLNNLKRDFPSDWTGYYHLVVLPTYKEPVEVLKPAFDAVISSQFPKKKIFLAVGCEERDDPLKITQIQEYLKKEGQKIGGAFVTTHPYGLTGEIAGPATNRNWIVKNATQEFKKRGIKLNQVIVTTLDADFVIHPKFLAGVLHKYLSTPKDERPKRSFTGVFLYHNNYWDCPAPMRLISTGTAFWQLSEMVGSDKYINFSSLSINLQSLLDIGLWIPNKVNDDAGFYWKAYYHYKGNYKVIPHYLPILGDTVSDVSVVKAFQNQYLQLKRWAYGVEHIPFIVRQYFSASKEHDFWNKTDKLVFILWSYTKWGTLALFITFGGMLVPVINPSYSQSVVSYNLPIISSWILTAAFIGLFSTIYVHEKTAPKRPKNWSAMQRVWSYIQWALVPVILVTIASIPAIDAQTRLMLGKYLEYRTTIKVRTSL